MLHAGFPLAAVGGQVAEQRVDMVERGPIDEAAPVALLGYQAGIHELLEVKRQRRWRDVGAFGHHARGHSAGASHDQSPKDLQAQRVRERGQRSEADVEAWLDTGDITVRLIRAIVAGCKISPMLNAWYNGQDKTVRIIEKIDVGMAINTDDGLFVAVMRNVAIRDNADLRRGLNNLKQAVQARQIPLDEMRGATITLSNFGVSGAGRFANLVVVPPQVAIVGAGTIRPRVIAKDGAPAVRRTLPLSLTFDHRVVTGIEAANFLKAMVTSLEERG